MEGFSKSNIEEAVEKLVELECSCRCFIEILSFTAFSGVVAADGVDGDDDDDEENVDGMDRQRPPYY